MHLLSVVIHLQKSLLVALVLRQTWLFVLLLFSLLVYIWRCFEILSCLTGGLLILPLRSLHYLLYFQMIKHRFTLPLLCLNHGGRIGLISSCNLSSWWRLAGRSRLVPLRFRAIRMRLWIRLRLCIFSLIERVKSTFKHLLWRTSLQEGRL